MGWVRPGHAGALRRQLFGPIRENFQAVADSPGYAAVDFKVSGTVDRPKTDLMDKLVGRDLRDLSGVISSLFGHGKKKKKPTEPAAPSPNEVTEAAAAAAPASGGTEASPSATVPELESMSSPSPSITPSPSPSP